MRNFFVFLPSEWFLAANLSLFCSRGLRWLNSTKLTQEFLPCVSSVFLNNCEGFFPISVTDFRSRCCRKSHPVKALIQCNYEPGLSESFCAALTSLVSPNLENSDTRRSSERVNPHTRPGFIGAPRWSESWRWTSTEDYRP